MPNKFYILLILIAITLGCSRDNAEDNMNDLLVAKIADRSPTGDIDFFIFPDEGDYNAVPNQDTRNPLTAEKAELGRMLFFETALAQDAAKSDGINTYSCATCHIPEASFTPGRFQGIADGARGFGHDREKRWNYGETEIDAQGIRPLTILNAAYVTNMFWNGRFGAYGVNIGTEDVWHLDTLLVVNELGYEGLETQHIEALEIHRMDISETMLDDYGYRDMYDAAFPDVPVDERYTKLTTAFAISSFVRSAITHEAPFQDWLKGNQNAMTVDQMEGAMLFFDKANCYRCHNSPSFNSMTFQAIGTKDLYENGGLFTDVTDVRNFGRGGFSTKEEEMFAFKVPQLYNLKDYTHFFHGSSKESIEEVVAYKINAKSENSLVSNDKLSPLFQPLTLSQKEQSQLIDFLRNALYDPNLDRYTPHHVLSGNCMPNNDIASRLQLGCD